MGPMSSGGNEHGAVNSLGREVARRSVERLGGGLTRLVEESSALFRWCLTMLVLLNGAALYVSISARDVLDPSLFQQLVLIFFAGVMTALLAALVGIFLMLPVASAMRRAITHWTEVSVTGVPTDEAMTSARRVKRASSLWLTVMGLIGLCSLALFASGALMLGERFAIIAPPGEEIVASDDAALADLLNEASLAPDNAMGNVIAEAEVQAPQPAPPAPVAKAPAPPAARAAPARPAPPKPAPPKPAPSQPARATQPVAAPRPAPPPPPRPAVTPVTPAPLVVSPPPVAPAPVPPVVE